MRVFMPLYSIGAWGRIYGKYPFGSFYPDGARLYGYCIYQRRHDKKGIYYVKEKYYFPTKPLTQNQINYQIKFAYGVKAWQKLEEKDHKIWDRYGYPRRMSGYNRFLHYFMLDKIV